MKIVGLITEYNPFHNGHQYHLEKALELTNADAAIVVMSGNYVQRGTPAIMPKHLRAEIALKSGAAVVLELPVCYASGSAEYFALGAVSLLEQLGCVNALCFGTESGDLAPLKKTAKILLNEPVEYKSALQYYLKAGHSFPAARQKALQEYTADREICSCLNQPNNILGIEYLKALYTLESRIVPYALQRKESNYHDTELQSSYSSASAIRKLLAYTSHAIHTVSDGIYDEPVLSDILTRLEEQVPPACIELLEETHRIRYPIYSNDFSLLLKYRLLTLTAEELTEYVDITPDLANRISKNKNEFVSFDQFCDVLKTRELTHTRISRALLHILLNIKKTDLEKYTTNGLNGYAHILGFRRDCTDVLSIMKQHSAIPLLTKLSSASHLNEPAQKMLMQDIFASDLYESVVTNKFKTPFINEHEHSIIRI